MVEFESVGRREEMECRSGVVETVRGNVVLVRITREKSCEACASKSHCGALFGSDTIIEVESSRELKAGDMVEIGLNPSAILSASTWFFVVPVVLFVLGLSAGYYLGGALGIHQQWLGFGLGVLLLIAGFLMLKIFTPAMQRSQKYEPVITRILSD